MVASPKTHPDASRGEGPDIESCAGTAVATGASILSLFHPPKDVKDGWMDAVRKPLSSGGPEECPLFGNLLKIWQI